MASISVRDVSVDIPIYDVRSASLRNRVLSRAVGGRFAQAGSHVSVSALKNVSFESFGYQKADWDKIEAIK